MTIYRFEALKEAVSRKPLEINYSERVSKYFGSNVFGKEAMQEFLPRDAYKSLEQIIATDGHVDSKFAEQVASSMKAWALSKGATHYTHWFQPLNGATAEKHDVFFNPAEESFKIEQFEGNQLLQQEPDASSFPSGGIRNTFEARGYTAWDPSSPAFIINGTLCIPTIFVSYTGEALDYKVPLFRSLDKLNHAAVEVCRYFRTDITKVFATLGWEQEYFLIDEALYYARPDLVLTGRTLLGHIAAKSQQLEDHYFGAIPERAAAFMKEFEIEAWKLGIPVKTRHNEVAPNQFELAPIYEEINISIDHNQLIMVIMEKIARKHNFRVLFHEKPFAGINGSGKHNNWSLATNTGINLLSPGKSPNSNFLFLTFFINVIQAVYEHADLLRASIASAGNDHRLGANEAPPAIISVFIGKEMTLLFNEIKNKIKNNKLSSTQKSEMKLNIGKLPHILLDNTDRNRTSPFAFTGNKFEFRAVGSSANCASAMITLNTIVADQLVKFKSEVDSFISKKTDKEEAIFKVLRSCLKSSEKILFEGNGYGEEWVKEAEARGLSNIRDTPSALKSFISGKSKKLFIDNGIYNLKELSARYELMLENYTKIIQIESRVIGDLSTNHVIPTAIRYQNTMIENVRGLKEILPAKEYKKQAGPVLQNISKVSCHIAGIIKGVEAMTEERKKANAITDPVRQARAYCEHVRPFFDSIRNDVDRLEILIDDELWPLPKYREMLFVK